jgi:hypothetical protein
MAGSLTLGGMADGLVAGQVTVGPSTMTGKQAISEVINLELEANVDKKIAVPPEAVAFAFLFTFTGSEGPEVKLRTNKNEADGGFPLIAQGWGAMPLAAGIKELIFKAATAPKLFQLVFV